jgi:MoaA/NifB/PqqE/SkfB family radical SAM enzyme
MTLWYADEINKIKLTMDVSTYCNAGCPQCHRTDPNGLQKADWVPLIQWSINQFKKAIKPEDFKYIQQVCFVGTWGDCMMNKDIFEIIEYCIDNQCNVTVETNGSIRDEEWWWELGIMGGKLLQVRFDVDGINQEMHAKYRRFTSLQKVLNNMYTFSQTQARAASQTVVFKHNQDYLKEILQLCKDYGSEWHTNVISDRFYSENSSNGIFTFTNKDGEIETLEESKPEVLENPVISGVNVRQLSNDITCRWSAQNRVYILSNGDLVPCCYHGNSYWKYLQTGKESELTRSPHFKKYIKNREKYNIFKIPINDILKSDWYTNTLKNSFTSDNPIPQCVKICSSRIRKEQQLRSFTTNVS